MKKSGQQKIYEMINKQILDQLEKGVIPWKKPWTGGAAGMPVNLKSKKAYRGINIWLLSSMGFTSKYWASFKQITQAGGKVKKGETGTLVIFWNFFEVEKENSEGIMKTEKIPYMKYYKVFNLDQTEGIADPEGITEEPEEEKTPFEEITAAQAILDNMKEKPEVRHSGQGRCYYSPAGDYIHMTDKDRFDNPAMYYAVRFHETGHWTGHSSRLNREGIVKFDAFGSHRYSKEELVAEFTAAFLCGTAGIAPATIENSAAYIQSWVKALKNNKKWLVQAAANAQRATDFVLNIKHEEQQKAA